MLNRQTILLSLFFSLFLASCGSHSFNDMLECTEIECLLEGSNILSITGYLAEKEDLTDVPQDIMLSNFTSNSSIPTKVSLEDKFPPVQSQGQYGTCVAWATGYNLKTALNAIEKGWGRADLAKPENQTSPKDLFFNINPKDKGENCYGTTYTAALDVLVLNGAATMSSVPYANMGNCSGSSIGNQNNKLSNYRKIAYNYKLYTNTDRTESEGMTVDNFKGYLAQGRPILFGARLGDKFRRWKGTAVLTSDTYENPGGHGMVVTGYDDSKEAFRVRNSWGTNWGDDGSIWVGYNFFLTSFAHTAFVAQNGSVPVGEEVKKENLLEGYDLLAANGDDYPDPLNRSNPRARAFSYDVYNSGKETIYASQRWSVIYMYYDANDANKYEIIFEDYYTDQKFDNGNKDCNYLCGAYYETQALVGALWNNMDVLPGKKAGETEFGSEGFEIGYEMPDITGKFYLLVYADAYDEISEANEDNNFYFIGALDGKPLEIKNGILQDEPYRVTAKLLAKSTSGSKTPRAPATSVQEIGGSPNAYTPAEIKSLVLHSKKNGSLAKKIADYRENGKKPIKRLRE